MSTILPAQQQRRPLCDHFAGPGRQLARQHRQRPALECQAELERFIENARPLA
jgi:hypothetical protein